MFSDVFNGAQIYALSKKELEAGTLGTMVHIGNLPLAEGTAYSVQPATSRISKTKPTPVSNTFSAHLTSLARSTIESRYGP